MSDVVSRPACAGMRGRPYSMVARSSQLHCEFPDRYPPPLHRRGHRLKW
jgi:hypothetical protein